MKKLHHTDITLGFSYYLESRPSSLIVVIEVQKDQVKVFDAYFKPPNSFRWVAKNIIIRQVESGYIKVLNKTFSNEGKKSYLKPHLEYLKKDVEK